MRHKTCYSNNQIRKMKKVIAWWASLTQLQVYTALLFRLAVWRMLYICLFVCLSPWIGATTRGVGPEATAQRPQPRDHRPGATVQGLWSRGYKPGAMDLGLWTRGYGPGAMDPGLWTRGYRPGATDQGRQSRDYRSAGKYGPEATAHGPWATSQGLQTRYYRLLAFG